ncbi:MAG: hypothetical protein J6W85_08140 [Lachnospiraceae bacterium]|nr:hypothetical protein [Lachnospiraceae bacterium]
MASSIVHLAITSELIKKIKFRDPARLKFGAVVVDAGVGGNQFGNTHMKVFVQDGKKKTYDLDGYREKFGARMLTDDLYMGYYLHLVQDSLYRHYVYDIHHWNPRIPGNVERLHKDYEILNKYVIDKYRLINDLTVPDGFRNEDINRLGDFDTDELQRNMNAFFSPVDEGPIFFFTKEMSDEFIGEAVEFCAEEVRKLRNGEQGLDMMKFAWNSSPVQMK